MGAYLEKPLTEKETDFYETNELFACSCSMQGWKVTMETSSIICMHLEDNEETSFFGVFDGHGGTYVSNACRESLLSVFLSQPEYKGRMTTVEEYKSLLKRGFIEMDKQIRELAKENEGEHCGSTAIIAFITPSQIIVANCGDSRCVLSRGKNAIPLSSDHKPCNLLERERIRAAGGCVISNRVNGDLAVSRSLGDFAYKTNTSLSVEKQLVSPEPDILVVDRVADDDFVILACDGIWNGIPEPQNCVEMMSDLLRQPPQHPVKLYPICLIYVYNAIRWII